jgi:histidine kinase-like protein
VSATKLWSHHEAFAVHPVSAARARQFVGLHLRDHDMVDLVYDVQLVVSELATNAMLHAQTPFSVILIGFVGAVRLEVADGSQDGPFKVTPQLLDTNGRGIAIVSKLTRDWGVSSGAAGGKSVWAMFDLP